MSPRTCISMLILLFLVSMTMASDYVNKTHTKPWLVRFYPKKTLFKKSDLIDKGCNVFLKDCPAIYKQNFICARHFDGRYKTFNNFCEMEFENCNGWRQWSMIKQIRC